MPFGPLDNTRLSTWLVIALVAIGIIVVVWAVQQP